MTTRIWLPSNEEGHLYLAKWLARKIPDYEPRFVRCIACYKVGKEGAPDRLAAVMGYSNKHYNRVEISMANESGVFWFTRANVLQMLGLPFQSMGAEALTAMVYRTNKPIRRYLQFAGFKQEGNIRKITETGRNMLMYGLLKSEYEALIERLLGAEVKHRFHELYG